MNELSLFTGIGGGLLGSLLLGWTPIGYVEIDDYCQQIIRKRINDGVFPDAPIFGDIRAFIAEGFAASYTGMVDILTAGFPCQPFSVAGKRKGADDDRNMWPATIECIRIVRPREVFLENVPGLLSSGYFGTILGDLAEAGYDCRWCCLSASDVGANHRRKRLWVLAYSTGGGWQTNQNESSEFISAGTCADVANTGLMGCSKRTNKCGTERKEVGGCEPCERGQKPANAADPSWWAVEPDLRRVFDELSKRMDKIVLTSKPPTANVVSEQLNKGDSDATTKKARPGKVLQALQSEDDPKKVSVRIRRYGGLQEAQILRSPLHGKSSDKRSGNQISSMQEGKEIHQEELSGMSERGKLSGSSYRQKSDKQFPRKPNDLMWFMPYKVALEKRQNSTEEEEFLMQYLWQACTEIGYVPKALSEIQEIWQSMSNEEKDWIALRITSGTPWCAEWPNTPRLTTNIENRVDRLKGLGNAQVPLQMAVAYATLSGERLRQEMLL